MFSTPTKQQEDATALARAADEAEAFVEFAISVPGCIVLGLHLATAPRETGGEGDESFRGRARQLVDGLIMKVCGALPAVCLGSAEELCQAVVQNGQVDTSDFEKRQAERSVRPESRRQFLVCI